MYHKIRTLAEELGFTRVYFLPLEPLHEWQAAVMREGQDEDARNLVSDPAVAYPNAFCILLLVYAYHPFEPGERIPAYYLASQKAYLAAGMLCDRLKNENADCLAERIHVPARALALQNGIGCRGKNGLLYLDELGSRIVLQTLVTDICLPQGVDDGENMAGCEACGACAAACPANAIHEKDGLTPTKCMRYHMKKAPFPQWVEARMPGYLGCEICQSVCPKNAHLALAQPDDEAKEAFAMGKLLSGVAGAARRLTGKNLSGGGKLTYQTECFQKREKTTETTDL